MFSDHVVGGSSDILFPGVSYVEIAFASAKLAYQTVLVAVGFLRPCLLPSGSDACVM